MFSVTAALICVVQVALSFHYDPALYVPKWKHFLEAQENLTNNLFANYDPAISPVYTNIDRNQPIGYDPDAPKRWNYTVLLYYLKLIEVTEPEEKVSLVLELMENWYDPRLSWNSSIYGNISVIHARQEKVWSPTLSAFGVNEIIDFRDQDFRLVSIDSTGGLANYLSVRVSAICRMDVSMFPFDNQICETYFCLPLFNRVQVQVFNEIYEGILQQNVVKFMGNSEWKVTNLSSRVELLNYNDNFGNMELAVFEIRIQRNPLYYMYMIVFPSFIINTISIIAVFLQHADKMSKLNVGLTNIMTMTFILGVMADKIPRTGNIPLLGIYIIVNLVIMILAIVVVIVITELREWAVPRLKLKKGKIRLIILVPEWNDFLNYQQKLMADLFQNYDDTVAPVYTKLDITKPIGYNPLAPKRFNYTVYLYYLKLVEVIEPEEKVSVVLEMAEYWYDPRLAWNPSSYGDIQMLHMRQDRVWSPTISSFRINDIVDFRDQDFRMVCVENTGHVYTSLSIKISLNCPMNVAKFPYDSQTCVIQFCMPLFFMQHVEMFNTIYAGILNTTVWERMGNSEWDLVNLTNRIELLTYNDGQGDMQLATFEIKIRRNPMYYIYMIIFPSFIINALSIIGVFMRKTDKMSKVSLLNVGLTNIMTMTFILGVMADKIPKTGSIPLLGIYIIINLFIMVFAVGLTTILEELQKCAVPRLRAKKSRLHRQLEYVLGDPLETICMVILEVVNLANFFVMIGLWISDSG
ncbi:CRE-LGC-18 protein [Caenorhabditis remanei]|uniref:CRE-LGC-18 protein n=1 Tax=Caenorhabditis remanei TaxID=31234 RepID=E3MKG6_CAERE|nr:CRE-LGC-18 protein [Caenorhabditis remanei]